jgi:hypothetical protein
VAALEIDLSRFVPGRVKKAMGVAAGAVDSVALPAIKVADGALFPHVSVKLRKCTLACASQVTGVADLPAVDSGRPQEAFDVALMRLRVARPDGEAEACVRQHVPREVRRLLAPGASVMVLAHETESAIAAVDWDQTGQRIGAQLSTVLTAQQFAWPGRDEWPAEGEIEVHDKARHSRRLDKRRSQWAPAEAQLVSASTRGARTDSREDWKFELELGDGRRVTVKERAPALALARLVAYKPGSARLGGLATSVDRVVRTGAPITLLVAPDGDAAIDWEATLRHPELRSPAPL